MNKPKISINITRYNYVKNLLGDSYDEHPPNTEIVNVGKYTLAHLEGMQEFLNQKENVTSNIEYLEKDILNFISRK
jgi:hypothetical protein